MKQNCVRALDGRGVAMATGAESRRSRAQSCAFQSCCSCVPRSHASRRVEYEHDVRYDLTAIKPNLRTTIAETNHRRVHNYARETIPNRALFEGNCSCGRLQWNEKGGITQLWIEHEGALDGEGEKERERARDKNRPRTETKNKRETERQRDVDLQKYPHDWATLRHCTSRVYPPL